ncbi:2-deoxy-5-keto-D-gluconate 6-phosphate aldolase domain-containing protein [Lapillicoccus sp.]|uniref:2-deoxy-5-keto-D-gluconate 6-phosphate aldolase domain-containing protein n=1 Tax=Lapillicoccus sp. TaxID=1909287 RepID=UPI0025FFA7FC|nr:DUF2090 domain-containing protein [Lapillicoccus sp.]
MTWQPTHDDPLLILAMDHRGSFGTSLFDVTDDGPTPEQTAAMIRAKTVISHGLHRARARLRVGRAGVLVDERYGAEVIAQARADGGGEPLVLAVPVEASGHPWFTLEWGDVWQEHVTSVRPDYAKVLVRDNPDFEVADRTHQLERLADVGTGLAALDVPLIYELLVPATDAQLEAVGGDTNRYDLEVRPALVARVIADNQQAGVEPALWKVEGLETIEDARLVADRARADGRTADLIVLGRDAPKERVDHWLEVAGQVDAFVGFAIGRSIWEDGVRAWRAGTLDDEGLVAQVAERYLGFADHFTDPLIG